MLHRSRGQNPRFLSRLPDKMQIFFLIIPVQTFSEKISRKNTKNKIPRFLFYLKILLINESISRKFFKFFQLFFNQLTTPQTPSNAGELVSFVEKNPFRFFKFILLAVMSNKLNSIKSSTIY
jgi:hypothetical protein